MKQYTERPLKVRAEQFDPATTPTPPAGGATVEGICTCITPATWPDGRPHVHTERAAVPILLGEWVVQWLWAPYGWAVIPDAEFTDRFGGGGGPSEGG